MKKISLLFLLAVTFAFAGCSDDDDKNDYVISFENSLTEAESEYQSANTSSSTDFTKETFKDPLNLLTFDHYYADWGTGYSFAGFTYMNKTDNKTANSPAPISGKGKTGKVYIAVDSSDGEYGIPAILTINNPEQYSIKGTWITNSTYAYTCMTEGYGVATAFKKGSWYKVTATGYDNQEKEIGKVEISLADYKSDNDKPLSDWIWFDLSALQNAVKIKFIPSSSDTGEWMNTAAYFCLDGITLTQK